MFGMSWRGASKNNNNPLTCWEIVTPLARNRAKDGLGRAPSRPPGGRPGREKRFLNETVDFPSWPISGESDCLNTSNRFQLPGWEQSQEKPASHFSLAVGDWEAMIAKRMLGEAANVQSTPQAPTSKV